MDKEPTLQWNPDTQSAILTQSNGTQIYIKKYQQLQIFVESVYGTSEYGGTTEIIKIEDFIGKLDENRCWGLIYYTMQDNAWTLVPKNKNKLSNVHFNDNIWNSIQSLEYNGME